MCLTACVRLCRCDSPPAWLGGEDGVSTLAQQGGQQINRFAAGEAAKVAFGGGDVSGKSCLCPTKKICSSVWEQVMALV